ncbi:MAG: hypothetical protein IJI63_04125 [Clostridiales bacterium]|nr:hypothetical protein [Clostridiales bacterium]
MKVIKEKNTKSVTKHRISKAWISIYVTAITTLCGAVSVMADGTDPTSAINQILEKVNTAKVLLCSVVGAVGILVFAFNLLKALKGYKNQDDRQMDQGITGCIVGFIMTVFDIVLAIFA